MLKKKKSTSKFSEWKSNFYELILSNKINESDISELNGFIKQIIKRNELDSPNQKETNEFIDLFLPLIIDSILECRSCDQLTVNYYRSTLTYCLSLLKLIIFSDHEPFIESARKIIENVNSPFYYLTYDQTYKASKVYLHLCTKFSEKGTLNNFCSYLDADSDDIPLTKIREITEILFPVNNYFDPTEIGSFSLHISTYLSKTASKQDPRDINENDINQIFTTLSKYETLSTQVRFDISEQQVKILMKIVKSDLLAKQFSALEIIKNICYLSGEYISPILARGGIIDYLLKTDLHVKLVDSFSTIFSIMNAKRCITKPQLQQFWKKTIEQPQSTFLTFLSGMRRIADSMYPIDPLCYIIIETNEFPDIILEFLQILSMKCSSKQTKKDMYNSLYNLYKNTPDRSPESLNLLIKTIEKYVCDDDPEFCNEQQNICLKNIENDQDVKLSLHILNCTFRNATSENARFYFNNIINKIDKDSFEYLSLLVKIMRKFDEPLSKDEFQQIQQFIKEMVKDHPDKVVLFYEYILDEAVSKVPLLDHTMKLEVLSFFCDLPFTMNNFTFILHIYQQFNKDNYNSYIGIEYIWSYLFKTNRHEVANTLIKQYKEMRDPNNVLLFIQQCAQNFNSTGSLYALERFIHLLQDGIDLQPGPNHFSFTDDFVTVNLTGDVQYQLQVLKDICYEGFARRISQLTNIDPLQIKFSENGNLINNSTFILISGMTIQVKIIQEIQPQPIKYTYPSQILVNPQYSDQLYNVLIESDPDLAPMALRILNLLPTLQEQFLELNDETDWEEFLCIDMPYLLVYRIDMIANLVSQNSSQYVPIFYPNGMIALLNIVFNVAASIFPDTDSLITLLKISQYLLEFDDAKSYKSGILDNLKESVPALLQWIQSVASDKSNSIILGYLIHLLNEFHSTAASLPEFNNLVKNVIFDETPSIRSGICDLVNSIQSTKKKEELIIPLLNEAKNSYCGSYFSVLVSIAQETENPDKLWNVIVNALYEDYTLPNKGTILTVLLFKPPTLYYLHGLFRTLNSLIKRVKEIPDKKKLFEFIQNEIIFNQYKYYMPTSEVFSVFLYLLDQDRKFNDILMPIINACKEFKLNQSTDNFVLSTTKRNRGIRNMGATCYINSSIQQLYNITKFREKILLADFDENDRSFQFQYVFTKLFLFPSEYIDISNFLNTWKGSDNNVINVHQQQDSVEFLQLLIDRINKKIPNISSMFTGEIEHKTFYEGNEISTNNEQFTIFPLEVKNQVSLTTSLNTFLDPDKFEYDLEGKGKVNAIRFHKVKKAPEILIIQLKRFEYNLKTTEREKINSKFNFSHELDFSPVMANGSPITYSLCGVVQHTGTANGGHYFSDVKRDDEKWLCINDTSVRKIDGDSLLNEAAGGNEEINLYDAEVGYNRSKIIDKTCNAYLLFYKMNNLLDNSSSIDKLPPIQNSSSVEKLDDNINNINNDQEGISMECPGINSKLIKRLLPEIKEVILRSVCNTPQFSQLVIKICSYDKDGIFLYSHFTNCLRMASDQKSRFQLIDQCSNLCRSNQKLADFIVKQENDFFEFSIKNSNICIRNDYDNLISVAISCCSKEAKNYFYSYYLGQITNNPIVLVNYWECIGQFFKLFEKAIPETIEGLTLIIGLINFILNGPAEYDKKCHADQIYSKIDLSEPINLIIKYTDDNNQQAKEFAFNNLLESTSFIQLTTSPYHSSNFYQLISHLIKLPKNQERFIDYLNKNDQSIPVPALSSMFTIVLSIDKLQLVDNFFNILLLRNPSAIILFFNNLTQIASQRSELIIKYSSIWIKKFLITKEISVREAVFSLMLALLPQFHYPPINKNETEDLTQLEILFHSMIDSLPVLDKFLDKLTGTKYQKEQLPSQEFFDAFQWIVISGGFIDQIDCSQFVNRMKNYGSNENYYAQRHIFNFLVNIYGQKLFEQVALSKFISALGNNNLYDVVLVLPSIIPKKCNEYINSIFFQYILRDGFHNKPTINNQNIKFDAVSLIDKIKTPENINLIHSKLFDGVVFQKNFEHRNINYMQYCWRAFKENPQSCEAFYSSEYYLQAWNYVIRSAIDERPIAKMLAYFNFAFAQQNKDHKSFFKLKTDKLLDKYENYEDSTAVFNYYGGAKQFKIYHLIDRIKRKENPRHPGSGGLCHILRSFIKLSSKPKTNVFKKLESLPEPLMANAAPVKPIAMLVCDICLSMEHSKKVDEVFLNEFLALQLNDKSSYKAIEYFFATIITYFAGKDISNDFAMAIKSRIISARNIRILSEPLMKLVLDKKRPLYNNDVLAKIREKTQTLIIIEINTLAQPAVPPDTLKESSRFLNNGYLFVDKLTRILGDQKPNHKIPQADLDRVISVLNAYKMEKDISNLLSYTSAI